MRGISDADFTENTAIPGANNTSADGDAGTNASTAASDGLPANTDTRGSELQLILAALNTIQQEIANTQAEGRRNAAGLKELGLLGVDLKQKAAAHDQELADHERRITETGTTVAEIIARLQKLEQTEADRQTAANTNTHISQQTTSAPQQPHQPRQQEQERQYNLILSGIPDNINDAALPVLIKEITAAIGGRTDDIAYVVRLPASRIAPAPSRPRLVKVAFKTLVARDHVWYERRRLRTPDGTIVYVDPDLTPAQQQARRALLPYSRAMKTHGDAAILKPHFRYLENTTHLYFVHNGVAVRFDPDAPHESVQFAVDAVTTQRATAPATQTDTVNVAGAPSTSAEGSTCAGPGVPLATVTVGAATPSAHPAHPSQHCTAQRSTAQHSTMPTPVGATMDVDRSNTGASAPVELCPVYRDA